MRTVSEIVLISALSAAGVLFVRSMVLRHLRQQRSKLNRTTTNEEDVFRIVRAGERGNKLEREGGCQCGRVRFTVKTPYEVVAFDCKCSACVKKGRYAHVIVQVQDFKLQGGADLLSMYAADRCENFFCQNCGDNMFFAASSAAQMALNVHCFDDLESLAMTHFRGCNCAALTQFMAATNEQAALTIAPLEAWDASLPAQKSQRSAQLQSTPPSNRPLPTNNNVTHSPQATATAQKREESVCSEGSRRDLQAVLDSSFTLKDGAQYIPSPSASYRDGMRGLMRLSQHGRRNI